MRNVHASVAYTIVAAMVSVAAACSSQPVLAQPSLDAVPASAADSAPAGVHPCDNTLVRLDPHTVWYFGEMQPVAPELLRETLTTHDSRLVVTSTGGRSTAAISLLAEVERANLTLVVRQLCASACAHFLFVPANRVHVEENAIVAFHHTSSMALEFSLARGSSLHLDYLQSEAAAEQALYQERRIDAGFLYWPGLSVGFRCAGFYRDGPSDQWTFLTDVTFGIPSRREIEAVKGDAIDGFWPESSHQVRAAFDLIGGQSATFRFPISEPEEPYPPSTWANVADCADAP